MDRVEDRAAHDLDMAVEAVRIGTVFAHDSRAYGSWRRRRKRKDGKSDALTGAALEQAVLALQFTNPEYVVVGGR